ncbi:MAG TPA: methyltransferase domain-containing protein [Anaerolineae bacterium]|nr:methyltransferase domain-containing protein [Anaerolineae bacterium]
MEREAETTAEIFARYQQSAAGRLRYELAQHNLENLHDLSHPLQALDAAGGNGMNTEFLLRQGHTVTLLDSDPEMLQQAHRRLAELNLLERCQLVKGTLEGITELLPAGQFDLILCHHVLEYTDDGLSILKALQKVAAPAGELSLITLNPVSEVIRAIVFRRDPALARSKLTDLSYDARWFGQATLYPLEQITAWAGQSGWSLRDFRAIRVLADYIPEEELTRDRERDLIRLEKELAGLEPYRRFGRYIQFCFKKQDAYSSGG